MEITAKELREKPGRIIEQASRGDEIVVTLRGKKLARIVPFAAAEPSPACTEDEIFGLWKDRAHGSVEESVRTLRKGRSF
jgi:prevent-host-death family protein